MIVGVGMDLVEIARVERLLRSKGDRALARLFTAREVAYSSRRSEPARHFAARLAAKEAAFKALAGNALARAVSWRDIEVISGSDRSPTVELRGRGAERAAELGVRRAWLTMTHSATTAAAAVILEG